MWGASNLYQQLINDSYELTYFQICFVLLVITQSINANHCHFICQADVAVRSREHDLRLLPAADVRPQRRPPPDGRRLCQQYSGRRHEGKRLEPNHHCFRRSRGKNIMHHVSVKNLIKLLNVTLIVIK